MPFLQINHNKTYYAQRRSIPERGAPVVFIHGAGGTHQHWLYQVRDLPHASSFAFDLPGHGRSEGSGWDQISAYGDWIVSSLDALELEQTVLVGHSMGGAIALDVSLRYPDRVSGLGLVATGARLRVAPAILEGIQEDSALAVDLICQQAYAPDAPTEMVRVGRRQMGATSAKVLYNDFVACDAFDVRDQLSEITTPALVLCGTQDRMTPLKYATYLRDRIAGATLHLVEGVGHMVMIEQPQAVARALATFLERL